MNCPKCNAANADGSKFCSACGYDLTQVSHSAESTQSVPKKKGMSKMVKIIIAVIVLIAVGFGIKVYIRHVRFNAQMDLLDEQRESDKQRVKLENAVITKENTNVALFESNRTYDYYFECDIVNPSERYWKMYIYLDCKNGSSFTLEEEIAAGCPRKKIGGKLNVSSDPIGVKKVSFLIIN